MNTYVAVERDRHYRTCIKCEGYFWTREGATQCPVCERSEGIERMRNWKNHQLKKHYQKRKKAGSAK